MYKCIERFADLQDNNHVYEVGQPFPREGLEVSEERLAELAGCKNKQHKPLIAKVAEPKKATPRKATKKPAEK